MVFQNNILQELFKNSLDIYYAMTRLLHMEFLVQHKLMLEQLGLQTRLREQLKSDFRIVDWFEIRGFYMERETSIHICASYLHN